MTTGQALANHVHCGDVITQDTTLDSNLTCSSQPALTIQADEDLTLDLAGHTIRWDGEGRGTAVAADAYSHPCCHQGGVTIENGVLDRGGVYVLNSYRPTVRGVTLTGGASIFIAVSAEAVIENNEILGANSAGDPTGGIELAVGTGAIRHNTVKNGGVGIVLGQGASASITDNLISGSATGMDLFRGSGEIAHNRILDNTYAGIFFDVASGVAAHDNVISGNGVGVGASQSYHGLLLRRNVITHNSGHGITVGYESSLDVRDNSISRNGGHGVLVEGPFKSAPATAQLIGNTIVGNALDGVHVGEFTFTRSPPNWLPPPLLEGNRTDRNGDDGIDTQNADTTVRENHAWFNRDLGVEAVPGVSGGANWSKHNGNPAQCVPAFICSTKGRPRG